MFLGLNSSLIPFPRKFVGEGLDDEPKEHLRGRVEAMSVIQTIENGMNQPDARVTMTSKRHDYSSLFC